MNYFMPLLGLVFIALKLTGYIAWSWWLVTLPIYGPTVLVLLVALIVFLIAKATKSKLV